MRRVLGSIVTVGKSAAKTNVKKPINPRKRSATRERYYAAAGGR
jgi:hypothetical protein